MLRDDPEIIKHHFEAKGQKLVKDDQANMERLAPNYGITYDFALKQGKVKRPTHNPTDIETDPEVIALSVQKELWFPILRAFTSLLMERSENVRKEALRNFE